MVAGEYRDALVVDRCAAQSPQPPTIRKRPNPAKTASSVSAAIAHQQMREGEAAERASDIAQVARSPHPSGDAQSEDPQARDRRRTASFESSTPAVMVIVESSEKSTPPCSTYKTSSAAHTHTKGIARSLCELVDGKRRRLRNHLRHGWCGEHGIGTHVFLFARQ